MLVAGVKVAALSVMVASLAGAATPVMMAGEVVLVILSGILGALFEDIVSGLWHF